MKFIPTLIKTFFLTFLVISSNINAGEFKKLYDYKMWEITVQPGTIPTGPQAFKQFGNLTHFSLNPHSYFVIDDEGNKETFNINAFLLSDPTFINVLGQDALKVRNGILLLDNPSTNPSFDNWIRNTDLPGYVFSQLNPVSGFQTIQIEGEYFHFYSTSNRLFKLNNDMTEIIAEYPFPAGNFSISAGQIIVPGANDELYVIFGRSPSGALLCKFNVQTEEWIRYDSTNLPIAWIDEEWNYANNNNNATSFAYGIRKIMHDRFDESIATNKPILAIHSNYRNGGQFFTDNAFLYWNTETEQFDTARIDLTGSLYFGANPNMYIIADAYPIYELGKIVVTLQVPWQGVLTISQKYFMLYDWKTKTFEILAPPDTMFTFFAQHPHTIYQVHSAGYFRDAEGNDCIGLIYSGGDFILYYPDGEGGEPTTMYNVRLIVYQGENVAFDATVQREEGTDYKPAWSPDMCYHFSNLSYLSGGVQYLLSDTVGHIVTITSDTTLVLNYWFEGQYEFTVTSVGPGTTNYDGTHFIDCGTELTLIATPNDADEHAFIHWEMGDGTVLTTSNPWTGLVMSDIELFAIFDYVSVKEPSVRNLQISPNPTDALTTLSLELASAGILTLTLNDLQGRELLEIYSGFSDAGIFVKTFSMEVLPVGVYYLRVVHNGGVAVEKVIKE